MPQAKVVGVTQIVEARQGRGGVFWDGPYTPEEAARIVRLGASEQIPFDAFSARQIGEKFFVCFQFFVLDGFTAHGSEHISGYMPVGVFVISSGSAADWYEVGSAHKL